jgi:Spy/CpxP family protein refolding chaperone
MNQSTALSLAALSACITLSLARARADDTPPAPAPQQAQAGVETSPSDVGPPPPSRSGRRRGYVLSELTAKLGLTADQQKTVAGILAASAGQVKELRSDDSLSRAERRARMRQIGDSTRTQIRALLTPDQQKAFDALPPGSLLRGKGQPAPTPPPAN